MKIQNMKNTALELLKKITASQSIRKTRSLQLLKEPDIEYTEGWFVCLPACFNEALDIRKTKRKKDGKEVLIWTQGAFFSFKSGDKIYDTAKGYEEWSSALKHIKFCISVKYAEDVSLSEDGKTRLPGLVNFTNFKPNKNSSDLIEGEERTMTQDEFVKYLIVGE
jgi:hypothetical protein